MLFRSVGMFTFNALGEDLKYDWLNAHQEAVFREWVVQARICMADGVRYQLNSGVRDSEKIVEWVMKPCGTHLENYLTKSVGRPAPEANAFVRSLAYDAINRVPALKRQPSLQR